MEQTGKQENSSWLLDITHYISTGGKTAHRSRNPRIISRVSDKLRAFQSSAFVPDIVSIGPLHYEKRKSELKAMEVHKIRFLVEYSGYAGNGETHGKDDEEVKRQIADALKDPMEAMRAMEEKTRDCYSESFDDISSDDFVRMMLFDGFFVVQLLKLYYPHRQKDIILGADEQLLANESMFQKLRRDLIKLDNQIPYFVLKKIFDIMGKDENHLLQELIVTFFNPLLPRKNYAEPLRPDENSHMLKIFRLTFIHVALPPLPLNNGRINDGCGRSLLNWCSDTTVVNLLMGILYLIAPRDREERLKRENLQLRPMHLTPPLEDLYEKGGIILKRDKEPNVLDIWFEEGVFKFPLLVLDDDTVPMFFNFVALEESMDTIYQSPFTNYFALLNSLICSESDVEILIKERILEHSLESNKHVVFLIKELAKNMVLDDDNLDYFCLPALRINKHYEEALRNKRVQRKLKWRRWLRDLKNRYFSNPWAVLSLVAAIVLLILTFLQTFYTMFAYHNPPN